MDITTIIVDEAKPVSGEVVRVDAEIVRVTLDGNGVEVWDGEKYIRRPVRIVRGEGNVCVLEVSSE